MPIAKTFIAVTCGALAGMMMGGAFGFCAGLLSPALFRHLIPWLDVEPVGTATVIGAFGGLILGGGLVIFAILLHLLTQYRLRKRDDESRR